MKTTVPGLAIVLILASFAAGQTMQITGRVVDQALAPLRNVNVLLMGRELPTATDSLGVYRYVSSTARSGGRQPPVQAPSPVIRKGSVLFQVTRDREPVSIDVFDLSGKKLCRSALGSLAPGSYSWNIADRANPPVAGLLIINVRIGAQSYCFKGAAAGTLVSSTPADPWAGKEARRIGATPAAGVDSLFFWLTGYGNEKYSLTGLVQNVPDIILRKGTAFEPFFIGTGSILDLKDSQTVKVPVAQRLHVIVFPEGYTQADIDSGKYERDLANWRDTIFQLRIANFLKEGFVIWKYRAVSVQRLTGNGTVNSYFQIPLATGAIGTAGFTAAIAATFQALSKFPFPPADYTFSGPLYTNTARNLICCYMLYNPATGKSGYSGQERIFTNPSNTAQNISVCMALDQHHEFMHGMASLWDEYHDRSFTAFGAGSLTQDSRHISNAVSSQTCSTLPWRHLLAGSSINPSTDSLIGAFGTNGRYHASLKCLMNGTHHNSDLYGGSGMLRTYDRMCNWCEEICAFRIYERTSVLPVQNTSWAMWVTSYRAPFYKKFGFFVPDTVPMRNNVGTPFFTPCTP